jgi:peptidoglycan/xylan/chitin deacetylase (PgdA/CDA1 family)
MRPGPTVRALAVVVVVATAIIGGSYVLGQATGGNGTHTSAARSTKKPAAPATTAAAPSPTAAAGGRAPVQQSKQLAPVPPAAAAMVNPIVGPGRPPLAADRRGPFGARITTGTNDIALTFDDGPDPTWTPQVLALLSRYQVKATFCLVGQNAREFPQLVRAIVAGGHTLCNHSWDHDEYLAQRSTSYIRANMQRATDAIHAAAPGAKISYYRQPGGMWSSTIVGIAKQLGMSSLHWAVDPQDWLRPAAGSIVTTVTGATRRGSIVLMHDAGGDRSHTVSALRSILPNLIRRFQLEALPPGVDPPPLHGRELPLHPGQM